MRASTIERQRQLHLIAKAVIARHYRRPLTLVAVARALSCSPRALQRAFDAFGENAFKEELIAARLTAAARLLAEHPMIRVADVARLVGYASGAHFTRSFKRRYGVTPAAFRLDALRARKRQRVLDAAHTDDR